MPRKVTLLFTLLFTVAMFGQNQTKKWYFGASAAANFSSGGPVFVSGCAITTSMGCSSIADQNGNLLFYTDGSTVYTSGNNVMANGTGLLGANAFQSALILKKPNSTTQYYVFTVGAIGSADGLYYSIVDMSLAAGVGSVTVKNVLLNTDCRDKLTAGRHCNGTDIWVLSSAVNSTVAFVACALTPTGIGATVLTPVTTSIMPVIGTGQMKISPNSHRVGIVSYLIPGANCGADVRILNFDNSTGIVEAVGSTVVMYYTYPATNPSCGNRFFGCEFSVDSRYLYLSALNQISRIDLCALPVISTGLIPNAENTSLYDTVSKRSFQMASDGKIYVAKNGKTSIGAINNPSSLFATSFSSMGLSLGTGTCQWGLPNMPGFYFEQKPPSGFSYSLTSGNCLTAFFTNYAICSGSGYTVTGYQWNFGDPVSGSANTSTLSSPVHFYSTPGTYSVTMIRSFQCNDNDTIRQVLNVTAPIISVINSPSVCAATSATAQVTASSGTINYLWSPTSQTTSIGTFTSSGIYTVTVTDAGNGFCTVTATTNITVVNLTTTAQTRTLLCNNDATGAATISVNGGSGNYQYFWSNATSNSSVATALQAGTYTVTILDNVNFCSTTRSISIAQPPTLLLSVGGPTQACLNQTTALYSNAGGGVGNYTYTWPGVGSGSVAAAPNNTVGTIIYTCAVLDANNCSAQKQLTVVCNPLPSLQVSSSTLCTGANLTLQATGATNYSWSSGATSSSLTLITPANGTLGLLGTTGICSTSTVISIQNLALPSLSVSAGSTLCAGQTFSLAASGQGSFLWNGPNGFISTLPNNNIINASTQQSGIYAVSLTASNSCVSSTSISISVYPLPTLALLPVNAICVGESCTLSASGVGSFSWSTGQTQASISVAPAQTTTYTAFLTATISGCTSSAALQVSVSKCTGISKNENEALLQVYPNPSKGLINIDSETQMRYRLIDVAGQVIAAGDVVAGHNEIEIGDFAAGIYNLLLFNNEQQKIRRIVLQN